MKLPWPNERQWFTVGLFWLTVFMLLMAQFDPGLWRIDVFKSLIQVVVVTGLINMAGAFNFGASKNDEIRAATLSAPPATGKPDDPISVEVTK